jgi:hypothetical protein
VEEIVTWMENDKCEDICPGGEFGICPKSNDIPENSGAFQCRDKKCTDSGNYMLGTVLIDAIVSS